MAQNFSHFDYAPIELGLQAQNDRFLPLSSLFFMLIASILIVQYSGTSISFHVRLRETKSPRAPPTIPYWFPYLGHGLSAAFNLAKLANSTASVSPSGTERLANPAADLL